MTQKELSPGEARSRQRKRRQVIYLAVGGLAGLALGLTTGSFDEGDGSLFGNDWENLKLPPAIAIAVAIGIVGAFIALPLYGFSQLDDYKREHNYIGFTGGMLAVLAGFPLWATLYAGGFAPPPHAFGIFAIGFVSMFVSFLFAKWRG